MLKSRVSFIELKPILDISLRGFSLSSLEILLLINPTCLLKYVLNYEQNVSFFIFRSGLTVTRLTRVYCIQYCFHMRHNVYIALIQSSESVCSIFEYEIATHAI
jgi:hypothetical protein